MWCSTLLRTGSVRVAAWIWVAVTGNASTWDRLKITGSAEQMTFDPVVVGKGSLERPSALHLHAFALV